MPFNIERSCFSNFKPRSKQMLNVLNSGGVGQTFFILVQQRFLNLFTCAHGAKILIQPLLQF